MQSAKKDRRVYVRLSETEKADVLANSKKYGYANLSGYIRDISRNSIIINIDTSDLEKTLHQVAGIGRNINQIAKYCNIDKKVELGTLVRIQEYQEEIVKILKKQYDVIAALVNYTA